jgi:hypothetical protein
MNTNSPKMLAIKTLLILDAETSLLAPHKLTGLMVEMIMY